MWRAAVACGLAAVLSGCESPSTPELVVSCSATPASGSAPLRVSFNVNVSGGEGAFTVRINYGDGTEGVDPLAPHTYVSPGSYVAGFNVATSTQSALCTANVQVGPRANPIIDPTPTPGPPSPSTNRPPEPSFRTNPDPQPGGFFRGSPNLTVQYNLCQTVDPDGDRLFFKMDLDGDGDFEVAGPTGADCRREHTYRAVGTVEPRVCVSDLAPSLQPFHPFQCRTYTVVLKKAK